MTGRSTRETGPSRRAIVGFRPGALGDTILTLDALVGLRARWPDAAIELVGNAQAGALLAAPGIVDRVSSFDSPDVTALYAGVCNPSHRWGEADLAVLWLPRPEPVLDTLLAVGTGDVIWADPAPPPRCHAADHLVDSLGRLGVTRPSSTPALHICEKELSSQEPRRAVVHVGSGAPRKNWQPERFAALISWLIAEGWSVSLVKGPADDGPIAAVSRLLGPETPPTRAPATVLELAQALSRGTLYVGNDSGVSHLSARLGIPSVVIFGPTDPVQWAPRGPDVAICAGTPWPTEAEVREALVRIAEPARE